jgi:hypothetical protein
MSKKIDETFGIVLFVIGYYILYVVEHPFPLIWTVGTIIGLIIATWIWGIKVGIVQWVERIAMCLVVWPILVIILPIQKVINLTRR